MAKLLNVPAVQFELMYLEKATEMKKMVVDYVKILRRDHFSNSQAAEDTEKKVLETDENGYPVGPQLHSCQWSKVTKAELEQMYRLYISRHYRKSYYFVFKYPDYNPKFCQSLRAEIQTDRHHSKELPLNHRNLLTLNICRLTYR